MIRFGLLSALRTYCQTKGIVFFMGSNQYINAIADKAKVNDNQLILMAMFSVQPKKDSNGNEVDEYVGKLALGRKRESTTVGQVMTKTVATLDETFEQKYDRRLFDLAGKLNALVKEIACQNELIVVSFKMDMQLNQLDLNADFVDSSITLTT